MARVYNLVKNEIFVGQKETGFLIYIPLVSYKIMVMNQNKEIIWSSEFSLATVKDVVIL